jgi:hypothetical protein
MIKMELIKNYTMVSGSKDTETVKVKIHYGFDEKLINDFPDTYEKGKEEMLFMFVPKSEDFSWFEQNININPYIVAMKCDLDEEEVKMEIFETIVDKMFEQQNQALEVHFSRIETNEKDLSDEN